MKCPHCGNEKSRVTETRSSAEADRRIRLCQGCGKTFQTLERVCVFAGRAVGYIEAGQPAPFLAAVPDLEEEERPAAKRAAAPAWQMSTVPDGVCEEAAPLLLQWWNESRRSKHKGNATWTEAAWLATCNRIARLPEWQQVALCAAGAEHGWQALKPEYLKEELAKPTALGRPMPQDPRMLAALEQWPSQSA